MKGSYLLVLEIGKSMDIRVGALGIVQFKKGRYIYVGSAMNSLEKRINRHLRKNKKIFWHIDYVLSSPNVRIVKVLFKESEKKEECFIARNVVGEPIKDFGSSDCSCKSHFFRISDIFFKTDIELRTWELT